jgi:hypothetical protein
VGGSLEGEAGYKCTKGGDCHLIVVNRKTAKLYEGFSVNQLTDTSFYAAGLVLWDMNRDYGNAGRGAGCTSADAAGWPIAPGLIHLKEIEQGEIKHALRFTLPNKRMRRNAYVAPATHYGKPENTSLDSIVYGSRLRLKASFDESKVTSMGAKVIVRALKKYGMLLADGGEIALMAESDKHQTKKWKHNGGTVDLTLQDLRVLTVNDFELTDFGTPRQVAPPTENYTWPDCERIK